MRYTTFAFLGVAAAAPLASPQDLGALLGSLGGGAAGGAPGGFDIGALLGGLGGGAGGAPGGLDIGALLGGLGGGKGGAGGGLDLGALAAQFLGGGSGPQGDAQTIIDQYNKIKVQVDAMNEYVKKIADPAPADVIEQLTKLTDAQVGALRDGAKAVAAMPGAIPLMSATGLQGPGGDLTVATSESIDNLKKAIPFISKVTGGKDGEIKNINALLDATKAFNEAVNGKLPSIAQSIAQGEGQKSVDFLQGALDLINGKVEAAPAAPATPAAEPAAAPAAAPVAAPAAPAAPAAGGMAGMPGM
jgi:hypothetical protein